MGVIIFLLAVLGVMWWEHAIREAEWERYGKRPPLDDDNETVGSPSVLDKYEVNPANGMPMWNGYGEVDVTGHPLGSSGDD